MKINVWKNRKPFLYLLRYYYRVLKPGMAEVFRLREEGALAEEKAAMGALYYKGCSDAAEFAGFEVEVSGIENLPGPETPVCFVANHQGYADVVALGCALGGRQIAFIAKDDLKKLPLYGKFIEDLRGIFIPTHESPRAHVAVINKGVEYLKLGFNMAIFPEGSRSWGPQLRPEGFKKGSLQLACRAGAVIVPVALEGSYHTFEENGYVAPAKMIVHFLPPVPTADVPKPGWNELADGVFAAIGAELARIHEAIGIPEE